MTEDDVFLPMWTVYENPSDYPNLFVARRFDLVRGEPEPRATGNVLAASSLFELRGMLPIGLRRIPRLHEDEPQVVEVWI